MLGKQSYKSFYPSLIGNQNRKISHRRLKIKEWFHFVYEFKNLHLVIFQLLRFLSVYDILVCLCGCLTYGLPPVWNLYKDEVLTRIGPWIAPITHAALVIKIKGKPFVSQIFNESILHLRWRQFIALWF